MAVGAEHLFGDNGILSQLTSKAATKPAASHDCGVLVFFRLRCITTRRVLRPREREDHHGAAGHVIAQVNFHPVEPRNLRGNREA